MTRWLQLGPFSATQGLVSSDPTGPIIDDLPSVLLRLLGKKRLQTCYRNPGKQKLTEACFFFGHPWPVGKKVAQVNLGYSNMQNSLINSSFPPIYWAYIKICFTDSQACVAMIMFRSLPFQCFFVCIRAFLHSPDLSSLNYWLCFYISHSNFGALFLVSGHFLRACFQNPLARCLFRCRSNGVFFPNELCKLYG